MKLITYGKTKWGKDFPSALEDHKEAKNYTFAFHSALSPLIKEVSEGDEHIMRACSLLAILPPPPGTPLSHVEIPMDLTAMRLPKWMTRSETLPQGWLCCPQLSWLPGRWYNHPCCQNSKGYQESEPAGSASIHTQCVDVARCPHGATPQPGSLQLQ